MDSSLIMLSPRYREIARRLLLGEKQSDIARALGMSAHALSVIINRNPLFRQAMDELSEMADQEAFELHKYMGKHAKDAADKIIGTMNDPEASRSEQYRAAKDVLGFAGHRNASTGTSVNVVTFEQRMAAVPIEPIDNILELTDGDTIQDVEAQ